MAKRRGGRPTGWRETQGIDQRGAARHAQRRHNGERGRDGPGASAEVPPREELAGGPRRVPPLWRQTVRPRAQFQPLNRAVKVDQGGWWRRVRRGSGAQRGEGGANCRREWGSRQGSGAQSGARWPGKKAARRVAPSTWQAVIDVQPRGPAIAVLESS